MLDKLSSLLPKPLSAAPKVDVFFGPVCDYSLAPVARYASYWSVPILSPGGSAPDFGLNKADADGEYRMLTRVGGVTSTSYIRCIMSILDHYRMRRVKVYFTLVRD